jgi:histidyl-tRNA synthetase
MQCDFDTVGTQSNLADIETLLVIHDLMEALGFSAFTIRVNNRLVLNGLLEILGLSERSADVLRALDKLEKLGRDAVRNELIDQAGATAEQAERILELAATRGTPEQVLDQLGGLLSESVHGAEGVARLRELFGACKTAGIAAERIVLDVSIARGLDYYTGTIYETFLDELPSLGSVCSGGRYDNLVETFSKQHLPGVGASLGLDRLLSGMESLGMLATATTPAHVLVTRFSADRGADYLRVARELRAGGVAAEVFPDLQKIGKQLRFADQKGFHFALIAGDNEFSEGRWQVKHLATGEQVAVAEEKLVEYLREQLEKRP